MLYQKSICVLLVVPLCLTPSTLKNYTLSDLQTLASHYQEEIHPINNDFYDPDFTSYFLKERPSMFKRALRSVGFFKDPFSLPDTFTLLADVVAQQKERKRSGAFILGTEIEQGDYFIVFGSIQGAFHSLIRDLQELVNKGILDNSLTVIDKRCRIICNGTALARSPYILQTLFVILLLMHKNPDAVFYMKSDFEKRDLWKERGLARQAQIVYPRQAPALFTALKHFIDVMPVALYANYAAHKHELLKITALEQELRASTEQYTGDFFTTLRHNDISVWYLKDRTRTEMPLYVTAIINGCFPTMHLQHIEGLTSSDSINMAYVWRSFSAPTISYKTLYNFHDDAFIQIMFGKAFDSSIIELFSRTIPADNTSVDSGFSCTKSVSLDTGAARLATAENLNHTYKNIRIGSSLDISKSNYVMGDRVCTGMAMALQQINDNGGVDNQSLKISVLDDEYTPGTARRNIDFLTQNFDIHTILLPIGTPTTLAAEDLMVAGDILVAFPVTGTPILRRPEVKGVVHFRPSFEAEVKVLLDYLVKESKYKNFGFFYQDDQYGQGCMKKAREVLEAYGIKKWVEIPYARNTTRFDKHVELLKSGDIEALGCFSASLPTQEFLRQVGMEVLASVKVFAQAFVVDDVFESFIKHELGLTGLFSRVVPNPALSSYEIVHDYRTIMDKAKKKYDAFSLEAYIATSILADIMKKVTGDITHTAIIQQFEQLNNYVYKGLTLSFNPLDRQISNRVWLDFQDGNNWLEVTHE